MGAAGASIDQPRSLARFLAAHVQIAVVAREPKILHAKLLVAGEVGFVPAREARVAQVVIEGVEDGSGRGARRPIGQSGSGP